MSRAKAWKQAEEDHLWAAASRLTWQGRRTFVEWGGRRSGLGRGRGRALLLGQRSRLVLVALEGAGGLTMDKTWNLGSVGWRSKRARETSLGRQAGAATGEPERHRA